MQNNLKLLSDVIQFAHTAHYGQTRKYTGEPYINHCNEVVGHLFHFCEPTVEMVCAAWLHDVVEDTVFENQHIKYLFGPKIAEYVEWLTDVSKPSDGNRAARKAVDRAHTLKAPREVKLIKLADLLSNARTITTYDPGFAKVFMAEMKLLLDGMESEMSGTAIYAIAKERHKRYTLDISERDLLFRD